MTATVFMLTLAAEEFMVYLRTQLLGLLKRTTLSFR